MSTPLSEEFKPQSGVAKIKRQSRMRRNRERIKKIQKRLRANRRAKQRAGSTSEKFSDEWEKLSFSKRSRVNDVCDEIIRSAIKQGVFVNPDFKKFIELLKSGNQEELIRLVNRNIVYNMMAGRVTYFGTINVELHTGALMPVSDVLREKDLMSRLIAGRIFEQRRHVLVLEKHERLDYVAGFAIVLVAAVVFVAFFLIMLWIKTWPD